jgi:hypothetical protein
LKKHLAGASIPTVLNYPKALPFYPAYAYLGHVPKDFPVAYANQSRILSLPIYPEMTEEMIAFVASEIKQVFCQVARRIAFPRLLNWQFPLTLMRTEQVHTLILGAGPSGLAAGYTLAKAGLKPVVLERAKVCGGLMGSIKRGDFVLDIGRKELYNRIAKVDALWSQILGPDYQGLPASRRHFV